MKVLNRNGDERGFTLIELLIITVIIGILAAMAIPTFAWYRGKAFDSAAISALKNAAIAQEAYFMDNPTYCLNLAALTAAPYSLSLSPNISLNITQADAESYTMTASHSSSNKTYTLSRPGGRITP